MPLLHVQAQTEMRYRHTITINRITIILRDEIFMGVMADKLMTVEVVINPFIFRTFSTLATTQDPAIKLYGLFEIVDGNG